MAALLHDVVEDTPVTIAQLAAIFGPTVAQLVDGVTKLDKDTRKLALSKEENLHKLGLQQDRRSLYVKIADRLHNLRTIEGHPSMAKQLAIAEETRDFFIPLAKTLQLRHATQEFNERVFQIIWRAKRQMKGKLA